MNQLKKVANHILLAACVAFLVHATLGAASWPASCAAAAIVLIALEARPD
jgi:hypothetical protein